MAYLSERDLYTHIYPEIMTEIIRNYKSAYTNLAAFPEEGISGRQYVANDTGKTYLWNGVAYIETVPVDLVRNAIKTAVGTASSYLNRYDINKMFSDNDSERTFQDDMLDGKVKDIACWELIKLANPNINIELFRTAYEDAIKYFKDVMKGYADPVWPLKDDPDTDLDESGHISWSSNTKRSNHF